MYGLTYSLITPRVLISLYTNLEKLMIKLTTPTVAFITKMLHVYIGEKSNPALTKRKNKQTNKKT